MHADRQVCRHCAAQLATEAKKPWPHLSCSCGVAPSLATLEPQLWRGTINTHRPSSPSMQHQMLHAHQTGAEISAHLHRRVARLWQEGPFMPVPLTLTL